jgi:hypothetical protein
MMAPQAQESVCKPQAFHPRPADPKDKISAEDWATQLNQYFISCSQPITNFCLIYSLRHVIKFMSFRNRQVTIKRIESVSPCDEPSPMTTTTVAALAEVNGDIYLWKAEFKIFL